MTDFEKATRAVDEDFSLAISHIIDDLRGQNVSRKTIEQLESAIRHYRANIQQKIPPTSRTAECGGCDENLTKKCLNCEVYHQNKRYHTTQND